MVAPFTNFGLCREVWHEFAMKICSHSTCQEPKIRLSSTILICTQGKESFDIASIEFEWKNEYKNEEIQEMWGGPMRTIVEN